MIFVDDPSKLYLLRVGKTGNIFRVHLPPGADYVLQMADQNSAVDGFALEPTPTKTIAFGDATNGCDTILHFSVDRDPSNAGIVRASINDGETMEYVIPNWTDRSQSKHQHVIDAGDQVEFGTDESINLMWWRDPTTDRAIMLWIEPQTKANSRSSKH